MQTVGSRFFTWAGTLVLAGLTACGGGGSGGGTGTLAMSMTDAPFPATEGCLAAALVDIDRIEARNAEGGFVDVPLVGAVDGVVTLDLLDLRAGLSESLGLAEVPTGAYDEVRLHIVRSVLQFTDGSPEVEFKVPSGDASGLKLKIEPPVLVAEGATTELLLDFDLTASFHATGAGGDPTCDELKQGVAGCHFRPVIRMHNAAQIALVSGTVLDAEAAPAGDVEVVAYVAGTVIDDQAVPAATTFSTPVDSTLPLPGTYALILPAGSYDLYVRAQGAEASTLALAGLAVAAGDILTGQDLTLPAPPTE
jgi:hypothetical protein